MNRFSPNVQGMILMTLSMAMLSTGDAVVKLSANRLSLASVLIGIGIGSLVIFVPMVKRSGHRFFDVRALQGPTLFRSLAEILAAVTMLYALIRIPYTVIALVMQSMPFLVTLGAVIFFGEKVGWRRWLAIAVGFVGVALILRPGASGFSVEWLLAFVVAVALSLRDLASRGVPKELSTAQIAAWGGVAVLIVGVIFQVVSAPPLPNLAGIAGVQLALIAALTAGGVYTVSMAMRIGDVSVIAPFRYLRLPMGLGFGVFLFNEQVDGLMLAGAAVVVLSGLYIFLRERKPQVS